MEKMMFALSLGFAALLLATHAALASPQNTDQAQSLAQVQDHCRDIRLDPIRTAQGSAALRNTATQDL